MSTRNTIVKQAIKEILQTINDHDYNMWVYCEGEDEKEVGIEIETWTNGGVDMIMFLDFRYPNKSVYNIYDIRDAVRNIAERFDIDEEIDVHRQDPHYRNDFTITRSVRDFEEFQEELNSLADAVADVVSRYDLANEDFEDLDISIEELIDEIE